MVVYLRSLKPIRRVQPKSIIPFPVSRLINNAPQPLDAPVPAPDLSTPLARGRYLVTLASCSDCHSPMDDKGQAVPGMDFQRRQRAQVRGEAERRLRQSHPGRGSRLRRRCSSTIRTGRVHERQLSDLMPWSFYRRMTDDNLKAIFTYLKNITPVTTTWTTRYPRRSARGAAWNTAEARGTRRRASLSELLDPGPGLVHPRGQVEVPVHDGIGAGEHVVSGESLGTVTRSRGHGSGQTGARPGAMGYGPDGPFSLAERSASAPNPDKPAHRLPTLGSLAGACPPRPLSACESWGSMHAVGTQVTEALRLAGGLAGRA